MLLIFTSNYLSVRHNIPPQRKSIIWSIGTYIVTIFYTIVILRRLIHSYSCDLIVEIWDITIFGLKLFRTFCTKQPQGGGNPKPPTISATEEV